MSDTLRALATLAASQPGRYEFLNRERADALRAGLRQSNDVRDAFAYARELLLAGQTDDAIAALKTVIGVRGLLLTARHPEFKQVYDLLGIAYLRLGEQQNCNLNPNTSVCILGQLHHTQQDGARQAIALYETMLRNFPDDLGSRWLLNVAYMAAGEYPQRVPKQFLIPGLTTRRDPSFPTFYNVAQDVGADVTGLAGGLCVEDFNNDGLLDILATAWGLSDPPHLLIADGKGGFVDRTSAALLSGIVGGPNCIPTDYDNDGWTDVLLVRGGWLGDGGRFPPSLLHNRGDGTFEDVTLDAGLGELSPTHTAAWADFNLDGRLDVFVGHESGVGLAWGAYPSRLFMNNGDGTFTDVAARVGVDVNAFVKGVAWGDVDNDGLPDLYVSIFGGPNRLYMNRGGHSIADWRFEERGAAAGVRDPIHSFPTWFFDYDNDGWEDLLAISYDNRVPLTAAVAQEYLGLPPASPTGDPADVADHTHLYHNAHDGTFRDVSEAAGLADKAIFGMGSNFGDIDNDGWLDFYIGTGNPDLRSIIPNRLFRGVSGKRFEEVTLEGGFGHLQKGHGTAFADFDRDGDEDVFMILGGAYAGDVASSVLFENPGWARHHWLNLRLHGTTANRAAIGARVEIMTRDSTGAPRSIYRTVGSGGSYGSSSLELHVGLGRASRVDSVRVRWPDSARSRTAYGEVRLDSYYLLEQGQPPKLLDRPAVPFTHLRRTDRPMRMSAR
ncbi:MAG TPA: FG-GAP-like repeat-containing protein [Gemmatimonadaceae bacterium]|nr:FG-GAP-like repeat-containing protein [Gemmatimonadaceae bacterium]